MSQHIVGISDAKFSLSHDDTIITYSLGSCIGASFYDPYKRIGGMIHLMLPDSSIESGNPKLNPYKYADTGIPMMLRQLTHFGANPKHLIVKVAGASQLLDDKNIFNIGKRNLEAFTRILYDYSLSIFKMDVGGGINRTITLNIANGILYLRNSKQEYKEL